MNFGLGDDQERGDFADAPARGVRRNRDEDARNDFFQGLAKKMKLPKNVQISPTSRGEIWALVATPGGAHNARSVQEAVEDETISGLLQERYELDPLTITVHKKTHCDAMFKVLLSNGPLTVQQHMDSDDHVKKVLRMPATLTDAKKKEERISACTEHVGKFQKVSVSMTANALTSALIREIHAGSLAIIFQQHAGECPNFNLKFLQAWTDANHEYIKPFEFEGEIVDEHGEATGEFKVMSVADWFQAVLTRTKKTPILVYMEAEEVLKQYKENGGGGGLLASKADMMAVMLPGSQSIYMNSNAFFYFTSALEQGAEVKRLFQTSERLNFVAAKHSDQNFGNDAVHREMRSKTPCRTLSKESASGCQSQSPLPIASPVHQPEFGGADDQNMEDVGEQAAQGAAGNNEVEPEEEQDPVELVPATGPLIVEVFVTGYFKNYKCGAVVWAKKNSLKNMIEKAGEDGLVFEHSVGFKQISDQLKAIAGKLVSFAFPAGSTFDPKFDAGLSAMLCAIIAGNAKLGMSIEANNTFQAAAASISFKPDVILRRLAERADEWAKKNIKSVDKWSQYIKMMEFSPWLEYMQGVRMEELSGYCSDGLGQVWKIKVSKEVAKSVVLMLGVAKSWIQDKREPATIVISPGIQYVNAQLKQWQSTGCPSIVFVGEMDGQLKGLGSSLFNGICGPQFEDLRAKVLKPGKLTSEDVNMRSQLIKTSEISSFKPMAEAAFDGLKKEFDAVSTSNLTVTSGISLGAAGKKIKRRIF
eukprot:g14113.t1